MGFTEIYFEKDDPEIVEYLAELEKSRNNEPCNVEVFRQWYSEPVKVYEPGVEEGDTPDYIYCVLVRDEQYEARKDLFTAVFEDPIEDPDKETKEKLKTKQDLMKEKKSEDKTFKKLDAKWKKNGTDPVHVFGPNGKTQDAPEEREAEQIGEIDNERPE